MADEVKPGETGTVNTSIQRIRENLAAILLPTAVVLASIVLLLNVQASAESAAADLANLLPIGFAFAAGMVASVNPCGFLMLPTYIAYQLGTEEEGFHSQPRLQRALTALRLGLVATAGFIVVLAAVGLVVAAGGQWLIRAFPYAGLIVGGAMALLGGWLVFSGANLSLLAASRVTIRPKRNLRNVFLFGVVYAVGSLSCTLPIFLVVVGGGLATRGLGGSFLQFMSYGLGMGLVLIAATVASALLRTSVVQRLRGLMRHVQRASALFLVGAGLYLIYYWLFFADAFL